MIIGASKGVYRQFLADIKKELLSTAIRDYNLKENNICIKIVCIKIKIALNKVL